MRFQRSILFLLCYITLHAHINAATEVSTPVQEQQTTDATIKHDVPPDQTEASSSPESASTQQEQHKTNPLIHDVILIGNKQVPAETIINMLTFNRGAPFEAKKSGTQLRTLYRLGYFRQIELRTKQLSEHEIDLYIVFEEKQPLKEVLFEGNKHLSEKEIKKKIDFSKIPAVDEPELKKFGEILRKLYLDKGYHFVTITPVLTNDGQKVTATFKIDEGAQSLVKKISFTGNKNVSSKKLRAILYTQEDWLLSFINSAGSYHPDAIEMDKYTIESYYRNHGYLTAKVTNVDVQLDKDTKQFALTFFVEEGEQYTFDEIHAPGNEIVSESDLLHVLPVKKGMLFSQARIQKSLEQLRTVWGNRGYIYADIDPAISPNEDTRTVSVSFYSELGDKVYLRNLNIIGNKKTRDKTIRRQIILDEGDLITTEKMDFSKNRTELLGFFDKRSGVNWKMNRVAKDLCDLDLIVKEIKTGSAFIQMGSGGSSTDASNPIRDFTVSFGFLDANFLGMGINYDLGGSLSYRSQDIHMNLINPWLFDTPVTGILNFSAGQREYEDIQSVAQSVNERSVGGSGSLGYTLYSPKDIQLLGQLGAERITYGNGNESLPQATAPTAAERQEFQAILNRRFQMGASVWALYTLSQDLRNHPLHPSRGHRWMLNTKLGFPSSSTNFGFVKCEADATWYTPLIGEHDLVFCLHGHGGLVHKMHSYNVPYRELFHVGGPATVRGFLFGEISPNWHAPDSQWNSIGATKAFWINTELIFPINPDFSIKGAVFYDGGAGWDTFDANLINPAHLKHNHFNYRHAVGVGVRLTQPTSIQVDWGFKLDRNRRLHESSAEWHFTMQHTY